MPRPNSTKRLDTPVKEPILNYWYRALFSPLGIEIVCSPDAHIVRSRLYDARKEAKDADLLGISVCSSPFDETRLWLVKKEPESHD